MSFQFAALVFRNRESQVTRLALTFQQHDRGERFCEAGCSGNIGTHEVNCPDNSFRRRLASFQVPWRPGLSRVRNKTRHQTKGNNVQAHHNSCEQDGCRKQQPFVAGRQSQRFECRVHGTIFTNPCSARSVRKSITSFLHSSTSTWYSVNRTSTIL